MRIYRMTSYTLLLTKIVLFSLFRSSYGSRGKPFEVRISTPLNSTEIHEGADFYFECEVNNPREIGWLQNGDKLLPNNTRGIIFANQSLVLQKVNLNSRGNYSCFGTTDSGIVISDPIYLYVRVKPETPFNCSSYSVNISVESVTCLPGYDGGFPQSFSLELFNNNTNEFVRGFYIKSEEPSFLVPGLENNHNYMAFIGASNKVGMSRKYAVLPFFHSSEETHDGDVHGTVEEEIGGEDSTQNAKKYADEMLELQRQISADVKRLADAFEGARTTLTEDLNRIIIRLG